MKQPGHVLTAVAEALDGHAGIGGCPLVALLEHLDAVVGAPPGRVFASDASPEGDGLAGEDARFVATVDGGVLVGHPAHDHRVGVHVGSGDVDLRPDVIGDLLYVASAEPLELEARELLGVDGDATLGAAERNSDHRALDGHPQSERLHLGHRDRRMEADPALGRAPQVAVSNPIAVEDPQRAVIHAHRDRHLDRRHRMLQLLDDLGVEFGMGGGGYETLHCALPEIGHGFPQFGVGSVVV